MAICPPAHYQLNSGLLASLFLLLFLLLFLVSDHFADTFCLLPFETVQIERHTKAKNQLHRFATHVSD